MPSITALLHTKDDALRLGRCLETLYPCDHILIVDHGSNDDTRRIARQYGARFVPARPEASPEQYLTPGDWILSLDPHESLTEGLAASLFQGKAEWKPSNAITAYSMSLREETPAGWIEHRDLQTRLIPSSWARWRGTVPQYDPAAQKLEGELLRFNFP